MLARRRAARRPAPGGTPARFSWDRTADSLVDGYAAAAEELAARGRAPAPVAALGPLRARARRCRSPGERADVVARLDAVIEQALRDGELEHEHPAPGRWLVDLPGTKKLKTVCGLIVGEHALRVEAFVCRQPDENREQLWTFLLQHNARMYGVAYSIDARRRRLPDRPAAARRGHRRGDRPACSARCSSYADDHFNTMLEIGFGTSIRREWDWRVKRGESLAQPQAFAAFADPGRRPPSA